MKARFNYTKMREQFYAWHGGMHSPLYAAASSGLVADVDALQAELISDAEWCEANPRAQAGCASDARYLRRVAEALPAILSAVARHPHDGRLYRCLPWVNADERAAMDWMPDLMVPVRHVAYWATDKLIKQGE